MCGESGRAEEEVGATLAEEVGFAVDGREVILIRLLTMQNALIDPESSYSCS